MRRLLILLLVMVIPSGVEACESLYRVAQDTSGNAVAGASVTVRMANTSTAATIYDDATCTGTVANPVTTDADGTYVLWLNDGVYDIFVTRSGYTFDPILSRKVFLPLGKSVILPAEYNSTELCTATTGLIDQIGSTQSTLVINVPVTCSTTKSAPTTLDIEIVGGGTIAIASGATLTINGTYTIPNRSVTTGSGTLSLASAANPETILPSGSSPHEKWTYSSEYKPIQSRWVGAQTLVSDGTQCANPALATINSGVRRYTIICADNDASTVSFEIGMPDAWDGGTVTLEGYFVQTAADTNVLNADVAMACRVDTSTINNTWGTEVAMDISAMSGTNALDTIKTAAITPAGTCTGDSTLLQVRWQLDASGTTTGVTTLHLLGFKLEYSTSSRSD